LRVERVKDGGMHAEEALSGDDVGKWQCALKARIISGGGFHPEIVDRSGS
jgi:hypothetical protein